MAKLVARGFLAMAGLLAIGLWALVWFDQPRFAAQLGPTATTPLAAATLRADIGGFFATWAIGSLLAAWRDDKQIALLPMLLLALAFAGRAYSYALTGDAAIIQPMAIEAVCCLIPHGPYFLKKSCRLSLYFSCMLVHSNSAVKLGTVWFGTKLKISQSALSLRVRICL